MCSSSVCGDSVSVGSVSGGNVCGGSVYSRNACSESVYSGDVCRGVDDFCVNMLMIARENL